MTIWKSSSKLAECSPFIAWPTPWAGKMKQFLRCAWLATQRARLSAFSRSGLRVSRKKDFSAFFRNLRRQNIFCDNYSAFTETGATQTMKTMQSDSRIETIDSNIFKSSQSHVLYKTMKSRLVLCDACGTAASRIHTFYWSSLPKADHRSKFSNLIA